MEAARSANSVSDLDRLFEPKTVAHVGASPRQVVGRFNFTSYFLKMGYKGNIFPVNPKYEEVFGLTCYPSLEAVPSDIDLVIMAVPAELCIKVLRPVPQGKIKFVVIHTSGFGEIDKSHLDDNRLDGKLVLALALGRSMLDMTDSPAQYDKLLKRL